jgi:hypothetical protein
MVVCIVTDIKFISLGLDIAGFKRWRDCEDKTNLERFNGWYGAKFRQQQMKQVASKAMEIH